METESASAGLKFVQVCNRPHTSINLLGSHERASCLLSVMPVVPERLRLNIYAAVETADPLST